MSLLFNMLSRLVITFLPRSKHLLISWLQSPSAVILEPPKVKSITVSIVSPSICHDPLFPHLSAMKWWDRFLVFWVLSLKPTFSCSSFTFIKRLFSSSLVVQGDPTKGNQSWIFIGRTDVEAETLILWPPDMKNWLTGKDPDAGKDWRR